jgi:hypothetical protein
LPCTKTDFAEILIFPRTSPSGAALGYEREHGQKMSFAQEAAVNFVKTMKRTIY